MKRSVLTTLATAAFVLPLGLVACNVESTENNTINSAGSAGTTAKGGAAGASGAAAGAAGSAGAAAGAAGAAAGSAGAAGAAAGSAGAAGAAAGSAGAAGAAAGSAGAAGAAAGAGGAVAGAGGAAAGAGGAAAGAGGAAAGAGGAAAGAAGAGGSGPDKVNHVRFAHLLAGVPTPIDICLQPAAATSWDAEKPFFSSRGSAGKFQFTKVSVLAEVPAGDVRVRVVASGATDCKAPFNVAIADRVIPVPAAGGFQGTVAIGGSALALNVQLVPDVPVFTSTTDFAIQGFHFNSAHPGNVDFGIDGDGDGDNENYFLQDIAQGKADYLKGAVPKGQPRFLVSEAGTGTTAGALIVTFPDVPKVADDKLAGGDIFNVFYTAPSTSTKDSMIVCASFGFADEQAAQASAKTAAGGTLPDGDAITTLCAKNDLDKQTDG